MAVATFGRPELPAELRATRVQLVAAARARLAGEPVPEAPAPLRAVPAAVRQGHARTAVIEQRYTYLIAHADDRLEDQARALGMHIANVSAYRQRLADRGLIEIRRAGPRHEWTDADDQVLREQIGTVPHEELAARLGTNLQGLLLRARRLGVGRREARKVNADHLNAYDVARILGVDIKFVTHQLIRWGLLNARRHDWLRAHGTSRRGEGATMQWTVRRQDLLDFLLDHPWQYDRERIADPFFRRAADEAWKRDPLYTTKAAARILGFAGDAGVTGHAVSSFLKNTAPKFVPRAKLIVRRRGNPRATWSRSFAGMQCFIPRSTLLAIKASGWVNYKLVAADTKRPTVDTAARLLWEREDRPPYVTEVMLRTRLRRLYDAGVIPTTAIQVKGPRPWRIARSFDDVLAVLPALFAREMNSLRMTGRRRAMIERHDPTWLKRPGELAVAMVDGRMATLLREWWHAEQVAARDLRWTKARLWAFVTPHADRVLDQLGRRTKYVGAKGSAVYHRIPHVPRLVRRPLADARAHGLIECEHCAWERTHRVVRPTRPLPVCTVCKSTFQRQGPGRPPKVETCPRCRRWRPDRKAA